MVHLFLILFIHLLTWQFTLFKIQCSFWFDGAFCETLTCIKIASYAYHSTKGEVGFSSWGIMNFHWGLSSWLWLWLLVALVLGLVDGLTLGLYGLDDFLFGLYFLVDWLFVSVIPRQRKVALSSWSVVNLDWGSAVAVLREFHI